MLFDLLADAIPAVKERLVVDVADATFIDATAVAVFFAGHKRLRDVGWATSEPKPASASSPTCCATPS